MEARIENNELQLFISNKETAKEIMESLSAYEPGYENNTHYRMGKWNGKIKFYKIQIVTGGWVFRIPKGFIKRMEDLLDISIEPETKDYTKPAIFYKTIKDSLPFPPYKHQLKMFLGMSSSKNHLGIAATGSGKSLVIYLLVLYYRSLGQKVLIVVPTIDLTNQLKNDFSDYLCTPEFLEDVQLMGGEYNSKEVVKPILISTYQSCVKAKLTGFDVVINDETHLAKSETLLTILKNPFKTKLGMTGSLPPLELDMLKLEQNFSQPVKYINARKLIDLGLATDVSIVPIFLHQKQKIMKYHDEIKYIKESLPRREFVSKFLSRLTGLTVALYQHTDHGTGTFEHMTGLKLSKVKDNFAKQKQQGVFFISGSTKPKTRRMILEYLANLSGQEKVVVIAQIKLLSTGINLKPLKNLVLLSSTKSYVTVVQSIGRVMRLHESKNKSIVYDLVDDFTNQGQRKTENYSLRHFWDRLSFYEEQGLSIIEKSIILSP